LECRWLLKKDQRGSTSLVPGDAMPQPAPNPGSVSAQNSPFLNRPARYKLATGTTDTLNKGVALAMADARKPRG
jgi:hypothetical protein